MFQYKANLSVINSRYGDLEQRVLRSFANNPQQETIYISKYLEILLWYLLEDKLIEKDEFRSLLGEWDIYQMTEKGKEFISKWLKAEPIE